MKSQRLLLTLGLLASLLQLPTTSQAQIFSTLTNWTTGYFSTNNGYVREETLTDTPNNIPAADQFKTTDPWNGSTGDTSYLDYVSGWTYGAGSAAGNNSVYFGGFALGSYDPGITNPSYYRSFGNLLTSAADSVTFSIDFGVVAGVGPQDIFGFDLRTADTATSLVNFWFDPALATTEDLRFQYNAGAGTGGAFEIQYGGLYNFSATLSGSAFSASLAGITVQTNLAGDVTGYVTNAPVVVATDLLTSGMALDFESLFINWELASGNINDPGSNYMLINTMNVTSQIEAIPEPGTWAVGALLLGGVAFVASRRRRDSGGCEA